MCGIVGLFLKSKVMRRRLGEYLSLMLIEMTERGPDSAGIAIYGNSTSGEMNKTTLFSAEDEFDWKRLFEEFQVECGGEASLELRANHAVITSGESASRFHHWIKSHYPSLHINGSGRSIEIYKDEGLPETFIKRFSVHQLQGTHGLGHTRMATESAVTIQASHPFSTGQDLCLVHNGSLSNHNTLRDRLRKAGIVFETDNDTEVAAGYLMHRMRLGDSLNEALERALVDLDGFYTFAIGTRDGFAVLRDPIACKPAIMAETDEWVSMASEYRAIAVLPGAENAECWEPKPAKIYSWSH